MAPLFRKLARTAAVALRASVFLAFLALPMAGLAFAGGADGAKNKGAGFVLYVSVLRAQG